jgi:hypothetical protein
MKKGKKAQGSIIAIVIIIIILVILIALLAMFIFNPSIFSASTTGSAVKSTSQNQMTCNSPYILVGTDCCLDQNHNSICDKDEPATTTVTVTPTTTTNQQASCSSPYYKIGTRCCLDQNRNAICDQDENYYDNGYNNNYVYSTRKATVDDPFHISNLELNDRDSITLEIKNQGDEDYVITNIDIDDCGSKKFTREIDQNQKKSFTISCDDTLTHINSDFTVRYNVVGQNTTQTAEGTVRITLSSSSSYNNCDSYDSYGNCISYNY